LARPLATILAAAYALLHVLLLANPAHAPAAQPPSFQAAHLALGVVALVVTINLRAPAAFVGLSLASLVASASFIPSLRDAATGAAGDAPAAITALEVARLCTAAGIGALSLRIALRDRRATRASPFATAPGGRPQRLLALAALRREIMARALGLTGADADSAAFGLEQRLRDGLAAPDAEDPSRRQLLALGLLTLGRLDAVPELIESLAAAAAAPDQPSEATTTTRRAFDLLLPPRATRRGPAATAHWLGRNARRLRWDPVEERFVT
jgi:hypothetical protein